MNALRPRARALPWLLAAALLAACSRETSILLVVEGDLRPGLDADELTIVVSGGGQDVSIEPHALTADDGLPQSLRILAGEKVTSSVDVRVAASLASRERVAAERTLAFETGEQVTHRICLWRRCEGSIDPGCLVGACDVADADADVDADADADSDNDADVDADSDADSDVDADADADADADEDADVDEPSCTGMSCDDGAFCNGVESCSGGRCVSGTPPTLGDGVDCTDDSCDELLDAVVHQPNDARCADSQACTIDACTRTGCTYTPRDADDDGYGDAACGGDDCDDGTAPVNPGADEACNGWDDDCDGTIDEEGCHCEHAEYDGRAYLLCTAPLAALPARDDCAAMGYQLIVISDAAEQAWAWTSASPRVADDWWIGLFDLTVEGRYEWVDGSIAWEAGTAVGYCSWAPGEPLGTTASSDCVELDVVNGGQWNVTSCTTAQPYLCEQLD